MNKAFVKEPEDYGDHCPSCGSTGEAVSQVTLDAQLVPTARDVLSDSAFFCPLATCDVAYFDQFERKVLTDGLVRPVFPKDPAAPICACFRLTCEDIDADVNEGVVTRVKQHLQKAQSEDARCSSMAANGQSCIAAVQRYFMQMRGH